jgi:Cu/Zn superoxide dismutase
VDYAAVEAYMKDEPGVLEAHLSEAPECQQQERQGRKGNTKAAKEIKS